MAARHQRKHLGRGPVALPAEESGSVGSHDSPFEEAVAAAVGDAGWTVVPQIGVSGFRIDLGIVHPDRPGAFLAGIECDGATYHSAATARDRDKVREEVLRGLGWKILRIWSPDWWYDGDRVLAAVCDELSQLLQASREAEAERKAEAETRAEERARHSAEAVAARAASAHSTGEAEPAEDHDADTIPAARETLRGPMADNDLDLEQAARVASGPAAVPNASPDGEGVFRRADLSGFPTYAERFYDFRYRQVLRGMIDAVMAAEAPVREDVLAQRIARAHGWLRTGSRIREQIRLHLRDVDVTDEQTGRFLWLKGGVRDSIAWRWPASEDDTRPVSEIAIAELVGCVNDNPDLLDETDPGLSFARLIGLDRLAQASRTRLEDALSAARRTESAQ